MSEPLKKDLARLQVRAGADTSGAFMEARLGIRQKWYTVKMCGFKDRTLPVSAADLVQYLFDVREAEAEAGPPAEETPEKETPEETPEEEAADE